ncbi:hypothetical protein GCM10020229_75350 [Kitasatospora albolonga]
MLLPLLLERGLLRHRVGHARQHRLDQTEAQRVARVDLAGLEARTGELRGGLRRSLQRGRGLLLEHLRLGLLRGGRLLLTGAGRTALRLRTASGLGVAGPAVLRLLVPALGTLAGRLGARTLLAEARLRLALARTAAGEPRTRSALARHAP